MHMLYSDWLIRYLMVNFMVDSLFGGFDKTVMVLLVNALSHPNPNPNLNRCKRAFIAPTLTYFIRKEVDKVLLAG